MQIFSLSLITTLPMSIMKFVDQSGGKIKGWDMGFQERGLIWSVLVAILTDRCFWEGGKRKVEVVLFKGIRVGC